MIDYNKNLQVIIDSITTYIFELDFEELGKEMELQVVPKEELERIGNKKVSENFYSGKFLIKLSNGNTINYRSIAKYISENKIQKPISFNATEYKFVEWVLKKDFISNQINRHIKKQLSNSREIDLIELQKALIVEDGKNKEGNIYIENIPIKESHLVKEGKFYIQSSCSRETAISKINSTIDELQGSKEIYIKDRFIKDYTYIILYLLFILLIVAVWVLSNNIIELVNLFWQNILSAFVSVCLVAVGAIKYNFMEALYSRYKASLRYEKEFWENTTESIK